MAAAGPEVAAEGVEVFALVMVVEGVEAEKLLIAAGAAVEQGIARGQVEVKGRGVFEPGHAAGLERRDEQAESARWRLRRD